MNFLKYERLYAILSATGERVYLGLLDLDTSHQMDDLANGQHQCKNIHESCSFFLLKINFFYFIFFNNFGGFDLLKFIYNLRTDRCSTLLEPTIQELSVL